MDSAPVSEQRAAARTIITMWAKEGLMTPLFPPKRDVELLRIILHLAARASSNHASKTSDFSRIPLCCLRSFSVEKPAQIDS